MDHIYVRSNPQYNNGAKIFLYISLFSGVSITTFSAFNKCALLEGIHLPVCKSVRKSEDGSDFTCLLVEVRKDKSKTRIPCCHGSISDFVCIFTLLFIATASHKESIIVKLIIAVKVKMILANLSLVGLSHIYYKGIFEEAYSVRKAAS